MSKGRTVPPQPVPTRHEYGALDERMTAACNRWIDTADALLHKRQPTQADVLAYHKTVCALIDVKDEAFEMMLTHVTGTALDALREAGVELPSREWALEQIAEWQKER